MTKEIPLKILVMGRSGERSRSSVDPLTLV
jgi:hypothetical protein